MRIKDAQKMMREIYYQRDKKEGITVALQRTEEEVAELHEAILDEENSSAIGSEIADVFAWLCSLANLLEIDVSEAFYKKYSNVCSKCGMNPCRCETQGNFENLNQNLLS